MEASHSLPHLNLIISQIQSHWDLGLQDISWQYEVGDIAFIHNTE